jgi:hypothetical protein
MKWQIQYKAEKARVRIAGFLAPSEAECREYFALRVSARLAESDNTEALRENLVELESTGFNVIALREQISHPPSPKDWEIGEAFAEVALADGHEAVFPWPTGFDKRTPRSSLPGPDLVGLQRRDATRFVFGQVKSSSEQRVPPQVICSGKDCLRNQMRRLLFQPADRAQLIGWLLVRMRGTNWESEFNEALQRYAAGDLWLVGVLVSGGRPPVEGDLIDICEGIGCQTVSPDVQLLGFYVPFHKDEWVRLVALSGEGPP